MKSFIVLYKMPGSSLNVNDVLDEHIASFFRVEYGEQDTSMNTGGKLSETFVDF
jgi:hypothetical protein